MNQQVGASVESHVTFAPRDGQIDPDLVDLPAPPRHDKIVAVAVMVLTVLVSSAMCWALRPEVAYAFQSPVPLDIKDLAAWKPAPRFVNQYVRATGLLASKGAIRYERPFEGDSFRLQPVAANPLVWVEIRVPEGMEGQRFVPPVSMVGRLVPMSSAGIRHRGLTEAVNKYAGASVPAHAWVLVDGASPRASRWAVALGSLFALFALWNLVQLVRILRPIRPAH